MRTLTLAIIKLVIVSICVIFVSAIMVMFQNGIQISFPVYWEGVMSIVHSIANLSDASFRAENGVSYNIFPAIWSNYRISLIIYFGALTIAFLIGLLLSCLTIFLPKKVIKRVQFIASLLESIPDFFIIFAVQISVIVYYKQTGYLIFPITGVFETSYTLPILLLSMLPSILFFRVILSEFENELEKPYVDLAKSKGLKKYRILLGHVFRNSIVTISFHLKSILWFMLSNLVMIEYLLNYYGLTWFVVEYQQVNVFAICIFLLVLPIFTLLVIVQLLVRKVTTEEVVI